MHASHPINFASDYLREYYDRLDGENATLLSFFARAYADLPKDSLLLDFGSGPTIYALISAAPRVREVHVADYLDTNVTEIRKWICRTKSRFDWTEYFQFALRTEGLRAGQREADDRAELLRRKIKWVGRCDALRSPPLDSPDLQRYDVVVSNFCAECISGDRSSWQQAVQNIVSLVRDGGKAIMCAIESADYYTLRSTRLRSVSINQDDLRRVLVSAGVDGDTLDISRTRSLKNRGYRGILMASGRKA